MYTAPNNPLHFVAKLQEHFNSLELTQTRDQPNRRTHVDQGLKDAERVFVRKMVTNHHWQYGILVLLSKNITNILSILNKQVPEAVSIDRLKHYVERNDTISDREQNSDRVNDELSSILETCEVSSNILASSLNPNT